MIQTMKLHEFEDSSQSSNERPLPEPVQLNPNNNNDNGVNVNPRRSTRVRKQPERYGQTLPSNIVI